VRQLHGYGFHKKQLAFGVVEFFYSEKLNESELVNVQRRYNATSSKAVNDSEVSTPNVDIKSEMLNLKEQYENLINDNKALIEANIKLKEQLALLSSSSPSTPIMMDSQYESFSNKADELSEFSVEDFLVHDDQPTFSYVPYDKKPDFGLWANLLEMDVCDDMQYFSGSSLHGMDPFEHSMFNGNSNFVEKFSGFF
jgi:regulator of replication initiation timing